MLSYLAVNDLKISKPSNAFPTIVPSIVDDSMLIGNWLFVAPFIDKLKLLNVLVKVILFSPYFDNSNQSKFVDILLLGVIVSS